MVVLRHGFVEVKMLHFLEYSVSALIITIKAYQKLAEVILIPISYQDRNIQLWLYCFGSTKGLHTECRVSQCRILHNTWRIIVHG